MKPATRTIVALLALAVAAGLFAEASPDREKAIRILEENYGEATKDTMLWTLNPRHAEHLRLFLAAGFSADEMVESAGPDGPVRRSLLQYTLGFSCGDGREEFQKDHGEKTIEVVEVLLDAGADPNRVHPVTGWTPLMQAIECAGVVEALLKAGADPNLHPKGDETPLRLAISDNSPESLRSLELLIAAGANVKADREILERWSKGRKEKAALIQKALSGGATETGVTSSRANRSSGTGSSDLPRSLSSALRDRNVEGLRTRLSNGDWQLEPVHRAPPLVALTGSCKKDEDPARLNALIQILFDHGASVTDAHPTLKTTALHHAAKLCPVEVVETLIVAGADPNAQELSTHTPLTGAVLTGRADTVAALLKAGAKVDQTSRVFARTNPEIERLLKGK